MDGKLRKHLEALLLAERDRATESLHRIEADEAEAQSVSSGALARTQWTPGDAAADVQEEEADFFTATFTSAHITEIDEALRLLADDPDALARCAACGAQIERPRLELVPWSGRCAGCAREDPHTRR